MACLQPRIGLLSSLVAKNEVLSPKQLNNWFQGITGVTGDNGWYVQFDGGAPEEMEIFLTQVPVGSSITFSTRFPPSKLILSLFMLLLSFRLQGLN